MCFIPGMYTSMCVNIWTRYLVGDVPGVTPSPVWMEGGWSGPGVWVPGSKEGGTSLLKTQSTTKFLYVNFHERIQTSIVTEVRRLTQFYYSLILKSWVTRITNMIVTIS